MISFVVLPSGAEWISAIPVILSLIMIEGLLSVDNAMAIAAMASTLPKDKQKVALRYGIIGAYGFRGLCLFFVAWISTNPWLKGFGAVYLIYLMCRHLVNGEDEGGDSGTKKAVNRSLVATIVSIEVMDLSLSLDNVVAAVALDKRLWVICTGVFIGILALRFVAGHCIRLIEKFPILKKTAFLLVGFVGVILLVELCFEHYSVHWKISSLEKFVGIVVITTTTLLYGHTEKGRKFLHPVVRGGMPIIKGVNAVLSMLIFPAVAVVQGVKWLFSTKRTLAT